MNYNNNNNSNIQQSLEKKYVSGPAYHEIQGYMPKRKEFEVEYVNDAEQWIKDLAFYDDDDNEDIELKQWLNFKAKRTAERKKAKIEKKINQETKVFCRLQTDKDYDTFVKGLIKEQELRERIDKLQEWRYKGGVCTIQQGEQYEIDKQYRIQQLQLFLQNANERLQLNPNHHSIDNHNSHNTSLRRIESITNQMSSPAPTPLLSSSSSFSSSSFPSSTTTNSLSSPSPSLSSLSSKPTASNTLLLPNRPISTPTLSSAAPPPVIGRKPANPLDISKADGIELLSPEEKVLCSTLRLLPKPYIVIKDTILKEYARQGFLKRRATRALIKIDVNKTSRIYDFFIESGWISATKQ
ncbi:unnamed protein product [Cunninghamella blakesleeana]